MDNNDNQPKDYTKLILSVIIVLVIAIGSLIPGVKDSMHDNVFDITQGTVEDTTSQDDVSEDTGRDGSSGTVIYNTSSSDDSEISDSESGAGSDSESQDDAGSTEALCEYLTFRNDNLLQEHYDKHGIEMGFASAEDYLEAANAVVYNPSSLHKVESEDGDDVYYLELTNEFVVVSTDGYIRTYFKPNDGIEYFNRQ